MNSLSRNVSFLDYLRLGKFSVVIPVGLTAFTGYFLFDPTINTEILILSLGVILVGMAASALNQVQESPTDSLMIRTSSRPVPAGKINPKCALLFTGISFLSGIGLIYAGGNFTAVFLALFTLIWYNGVYTLLKKYTAFAVIPGGLTGAIPPVIGWTAAGGNMGDLTSVLLAFLFFMGQVPHFWLLILKYGDQYKKAGFPVLTDVFSTRQINNLSFIWISASLISALMLAFFGILHSLLSRIAIVCITLAGIAVFYGLVNREKAARRKKYFILLNIYYFILIILLIVDKLTH